MSEPATVHARLHPLAPEFAAIDAYVARSPHSLTRLAAMSERLGAQQPITVRRLQNILTDHEHAPNGICSHPDPAAQLAGQVLPAQPAMMGCRW